MAESLVIVEQQDEQSPAADLALSQQILCTPQQAMQALGIGLTMLYKLLADESIRSIKIGKARRIIVSSMFEYVRDMESYNFGELKGKG